MTNVPFLIRPGQLIRIPRTAVKGACGCYSLLYRVNLARNNCVWVTRMDRHAPKNPHVIVSNEWLWRGRVVGSIEVPAELEWNPVRRREWEWAKVHNRRYAEELERQYG